MTDRCQRIVPIRLNEPELRARRQPAPGPGLAGLPEHPTFGAKARALRLLREALERRRGERR